MYFLIDLYQQTQTPFQTRLDLLIHWRFRLFQRGCYYGTPLPLDFRDLNVTGNDVFATQFVEPYLRRYQVVDEAGRSQDIRTWAKEIQAVNAMDHRPWCRSRSTPARFRVDPVEMGSKMPLRKGRYGAFTKQRLRDKRGTLGLDFEDDLLGLTPIRDNSSPRDQERPFHGEYRSSRSWKDSTKNASQWGRHAQRIKEMPSRKNVPEDIDFEALSLELCGENNDLVPAAIGCEMGTEI